MREKGKGKREKDTAVPALLAALPGHSLLLFVEDPGAANYVMSLPSVLAAQGVSSHLFSAGSATDYLHQRSITTTTNDFSLSPLPFSLALVGTSENPDTAGLKLVDECRRNGICSVGVVDAYANAAYRFRGRTRDPLAHAPDWLIVPDDWTQQAFVELGYPAARVVVCGHPHYDAVRVEGERLAAVGRSALRGKCFPDADPKRPVLVFVAEISTGMEPSEFRRSSEYTLHGWGDREGRTEIVIEELLDAIALLTPRPYLVLRLHPKNTDGEFTPYLDAFDMVSRGGVPLELIYAADAVVGMSSMLLLEAALLDRPTLSVLPRACEKDWLPTTRTGVTPCAGSRSELHQLLGQILLQTAAPNADINAVIPSGSADRVAAFLLSLLAS